MGKVYQRTVLIFLTAWLLSGCQAATGRTLGQNIDDANTTAAVKARLTAERAANFLRIDVDTVNGMVSLNGTVDSQEQKARAEEIARRVSGVRGVINNLQVSPRGS